MNNTKCPAWEHRLSRRAMLASTIAGAAAGMMGPLASRSLADDLAKRRKQVLMIWIDGGMSQLESWDPKPNTLFGGPFRAIPTSVPGVHVSELLRKTSQQMHHLAVVRSMCTQDNSHSAGVARIQRGDPKNRGVTYPYFGSAVAKLLGPGESGLPPYVWIKPGSGGFMHQDAGFLGPKFGAVAFGDGKPPENLPLHASLTMDEETRRQSLREKINARYAQGRSPTVSDASSYVYDVARNLMRRQDLFDTTTFDPRDVERYGTHELGRHILQARKMIEAGVTFVKVNSYGWDTHGDNFNGHLSLVPRFDQPFASLIEDLNERGLLDNTLVIALSEFGRTPRINGHIGRDHWPEAWSIAMAGCGVQKGAVIGKTNALGTFVDGEAYDIGHMFHTWFAALGIDTSKTEYDNAGQPLPLAHDDCSVVKQLLL
ncbi:protein of unknown function DUF1501 [Pirellula staleyi DSM 6068]|uniref:DUF1501 domain-containing protein n=1 Tax=Pirellula staleyi (strain ATCC 27377 / DSM 6068 / ICPB 4128) TaxID=530564 RepID=D2QY64_PIRSD|nr:DUF1501 domain-containing protein [Pirellula staleyi]ADB16278.1 protein of unknown function DUF1501 [Pirellula staleyi DSM 6068]